MQSLGVSSLTFELDTERYIDDKRRCDRTMLRELERWWMLTNTDISLDGGRDVVSFDEYKVFYQRLAYAVRGETLEGASLLQAMEADWLHDSKGKQFIVRQDFFDSIYEMALTWTAPDQETD